MARPFPGCGAAVVLWVAMASFTIVPPVSAEEPAPSGLATRRWNLESLSLHDGRKLEGLVVDSGTTGAVLTSAAPVGFIQIIQLPGRAMELIAWAPINATRIARIERLPEAEHVLLAKRVEEFRGRRGRQRAAETAVTLHRADEDEPWRYSGQWFTIESTADPSLTRKAVVLLEQVFTALEALVPPGDAAAPDLQDIGPPPDEKPDPAEAAGSPGRKRRDPPHDESSPSRCAPSRCAPPLKVMLCGTASEYRDVQRRLGIQVEHPAFYVPDQAMLVAGSDMPAMIDQERAATDSLSITEREVIERDREFEADVRRLAVDLEKQGMPAGRRSEVVQLARNRWQREREEMLAEVATTRRDNAARVAAARRTFDARLTHEAWHAYADRQLGGEGRRPLPLWLDEGLAQVFETAPIEAGELRLDAPDPIRLKTLQELLARGDAPRLTSLLESGPSQYLVGHTGGRKASQQSYLMAWGLAFHLAMLEPVLTPSSLAAICRPDGGLQPHQDALAEFERLVGMPIDAFEAAWRRRMLALRPR